MVAEFHSTTQVAVPSAADTWTDMAAVTVPANMKRLKKVIIKLAPDEADPAGVRFAPVLRLEGSGLAEQAPHHYGGPMGNIGAKTTSGAYAFEGGPQEYETDIAVVPGSTILPRINTLDEAITAGTFTVELVFDDQAPKAKNSQADYVDAAMTTTAGAWAAVGTIRIPKVAAGNDPTVIKRVSLGLATDQATIALLRCASRFRIYGSGLKNSGPIEFAGPHSGTGCNTAGILGYSRQIEHQDVNIEIIAGSDITVEQYLTTETPTAGTAFFGVEYA